MRAKVRPPSSCPVARQGFCDVKSPREGEESVLAVQGDRPDGIFDRVCVHRDAAIRQETQQTVPVAVDIAELFAQAGFGGGCGDRETVRGIVFPNDAALMGQLVAASLRSAGRTVFGGQRVCRTCPARLWKITVIN